MNQVKSPTSLALLHQRIQREVTGVTTLSQMTKFEENYIWVSDIRSGKAIGNIFECEEVIFTWQKNGFPQLHLTEDELIYFLNKIIESPLLGAMIGGKREIGFTTEKPNEEFEELVEMGVMERWLDAKELKGYRLKQ